jgi:methionyl aminopeptidase
MDKEILGKYEKAGRITAETASLALKKAKPGLKILELAEFIEDEIRKRGGKPAFPVNISINDIAAHYTPTTNDQTEIKPGDLVKIDVGVHVDGYIGDTAVTYCSEKNHLVEASRKVLEASLSSVRPGVAVSEIGATIEKTAESLGTGVIVNLTGHGLDRYVFHGSPTIPNIKNNDTYALQEDDVIAIEPFIAESKGQVRESGIMEIYRYVMDRPVRMPEARQILAMARDTWKGLPFARRWLAKTLSPLKVSLALRQLEQVTAVESYPALREASGRPIAQAEHTVIVKEKPIVTTLLKD